MKKYLLILFTCFLFGIGTYAQGPAPKDHKDWEKVMAEIQNYKHEFLSKELELTKEQQRDFFPVYDKMDEELRQLGDETRRMEHKVRKSKEASDTEIEAAAAAVYSLKQREGLVEMKYYDSIKSILTPKQMLELKGAERKFTQKLMQHHQANKKKK